MDLAEGGDIFASMIPAKKEKKRVHFDQSKNEIFEIPNNQQNREM